MDEPNIKRKESITNQRKYLIIAIVMVVTLFISSSYALLTNFDNTEEVVNIRTGNLSVLVNNTVDLIDNELNGKLPESDTNGYTNAKPITITITNNGSIGIEKYVVKLVSDTDSSKVTTLSYDYIKFAVGSLEPSDLGTNSNIIYTGYNLGVGESKTITLRLWIDETAGNNALGKTFYGSLDVELNQKDNSLTTIMTKNATSDNTINVFTVGDGHGVFLREETKNDTYPVYYYRGNVDNNLIFANHCWKIVRTTDTGGTKLIYNGKPYEKFTKTNLTDSDITYTDTAGFTYNSETNEWTSNMHTDNGSTEFSFSVKQAGDYVIDYIVSSEPNYDRVRFLKNSYDLRYDSGAASGQLTLNQLTTSDIIKVRYAKDGSANVGTDNIVFTIGIKGTSLGTSCPSIGEMTQIGRYTYNSSNKSPAYVGYNYGISYDYQTTAPDMSATFGNDVVYTNGAYVLQDTKTGLDNTHHYVCGNQDCTSVNFYLYSSGDNHRYITLTNGKKIEDAIREMLTESSDTNKSTIQTVINTWYTNQVKNTGFSGYIEDTTWCNDRSYTNLGGWSKDGILSNYLYFNVRARVAQKNGIALICSNTNDQMSVVNKKLVESVSLLTLDEAALAGGEWFTANVNYYLYNGMNQLLLSPYMIYYPGAEVGFVQYNGSLYSNRISSLYSVRPSLSLKLGTTISGGTGTLDDPYIVNTSN